MKLSKKTLTRLLDRDFRKSILVEAKRLDDKKHMGIFSAAKYFVDLQILQKIDGHENDKKAGWGFPQLNILCAVKEDDVVEKKLFEFKTVNHFLKDKDGDSAIEVIACILALWAKNDKSIKSFDYEKIDAELVKLDKQAKQLQAKEKKIDDIGKKIRESIDPLISSLVNVEYSEACKKAQEIASNVLDNMKNAKEIAQYSLSFILNTKETIAQKQFFMTIGFKIEETDNWFNLICHVDGTKSNAISKTEDKGEINVKIQ